MRFGNVILYSTAETMLTQFFELEHSLYHVFVVGFERKWNSQASRHRKRQNLYFFFQVLLRRKFLVTVRPRAI